MGSFLATTFYILPFVIFCIAILFVIFSFLFSNKNRILRELKKSKAKSIHRIQNGEYAMVVGIAKHVEEPLEAPISGRKCIYYHVRVERMKDKHWLTWVNEKKYQDFFLEAGGEMAIVKADHFSDERMVYLEKDHRKDSGFLNDATAKLDNYLERHGKSSTGILGFNKTIRYKEGIIELNEKVAVKGVAKWKTIDQSIEGYSYSKILTLTGTGEQKLLITDHPTATGERPH